MTDINFNDKRFVLVDNAKNGAVTSATIFEYKQDGDLVTADYHGGIINYGKIIARIEGEKLIMLYQCITKENEMKAGKAIAEISLTDNDKIKLTLDWQWLTDDMTTGTSEYIEL